MVKGGREKESVTDKMVKLELTKNEAIDLYFDLGKSIASHKAQLEDYKVMKLYQGVALEESRIVSLNNIRNKMEEQIK